MKKLILTLALLVPVILYGQQTFNKNVIIQKTTPALYLKGSGALIDFHNGDLVITQSSDLLTITGGGLSLGGNLLTGLGSLGIGTTTQLHKQSTVVSSTTNLNAFNLVNSDLNKIRTTIAQATDTSSFSLKFTVTGSPILTMTGKTGNTILKVDSVNITAGSTLLLASQDTTVTAVKGKIVFRTADSTFYGCRSTVAVKKWYKINQ